MNRRLLTALAGYLLLLSGTDVCAADAETYVARFYEAERPESWAVNFGYWEPSGGHLVVRQLEKDKHAAASRWKIPLSDAKIRLKLNIGEAQQFHLGFDPKPGSLKKTGHLYSLIVTPTSATIKKHKDKSDESSADESLATASFEPGLNDWTEIELTAIGNSVKATIGNVATLEVSDPTFHVPKPSVVFRVLGDEVLLDDVEVTVLKP